MGIRIRVVYWYYWLACAHERVAQMYKLPFRIFPMIDCSLETDAPYLLPEIFGLDREKKSSKISALGRQ